MRSSWLCSRGIVARRPKSSASDKRRSLRYHRSHFTTSVTRGTQCALAAVRRRLGVRRVGPRARVNLDYHIEVHGFLYSVPHALIRAEVDVRATARTVEVFHRGQRVAAHQRRYIGRKHDTTPEHMPSSHRRYAEWSPERFRRWAAKIGPNTEGLISAVLASRPHPEQGFRTCLGILRSYRSLDVARLEAVSARAVELGVLNCKGVAALLARNAESAVGKDDRPSTLFDHANLRGPGYFH
jgi:transposase